MTSDLVTVLLAIVLSFKPCFCADTSHIIATDSLLIVAQSWVAQRASLIFSLRGINFSGKFHSETFSCSQIVTVLAHPVYSVYFSLSCTSQLARHISISNFFCSQSGRSIPAMFSIFKIEWRLHGSLFSLHEEIIEHSYSFWFPKERTPDGILRMIRPLEAIFEHNGSK